MRRNCSVLGLVLNFIFLLIDFVSQLHHVLNLFSDEASKKGPYYNDQLKKKAVMPYVNMKGPDRPAHPQRPRPSLLKHPTAFIESLKAGNESPD